MYIVYSILLKQFKRLCKVSRRKSTSKKVKGFWYRFHKSLKASLYRYYIIYFGAWQVERNVFRNNFIYCNSSNNKFYKIYINSIKIWIFLINIITHSLYIVELTVIKNLDFLRSLCKSYVKKPRKEDIKKWFNVKKDIKNNLTEWLFLINNSRIT